MKIFLDQVIPSPLKDEDLTSSEVWESKLLISNKTSHFLSSNSGKGKSTFLNYLYGLRSDYSGSISYNDNNIKSLTLNEWASIRKNKIAYLTQSLDLINHLSAWENLILKNQLTNHYSDNEINEFLKLLKIENQKDKLVNQLSIGQQQRVALIRATLQPFELLLLDEPFSHLDESNIGLGLKLIESICEKENANYIIATLGYDYGIENNNILQL